jgi:hypothetical protein
VFGMGTGVTPPLESPEDLVDIHFAIVDFNLGINQINDEYVGFQAGQILWSSLTTD